MRLSSSQRVYVFCKSVIDRCLAAIVLVLLAPVFLFLYLLVMLMMGRPVIFTQQRMGRGDKPFTVYKFRTMLVSAPTAEYTKNDDPRITRLGAVMRKYRLDELPQFFNMLLGNMSLIGPRPEPVEHAEKYYQSIPHYHLRHIVKPGITGYAQVEMGYADSEDTTKIKFDYDKKYVENVSPGFDLWIVIKTIKVILTGFGAK